MARFNNKHVATFNVTGSSGGEKDIKSGILSTDLVVTDLNVEETALGESGVSRYKLREDGRLTLVCKKDNDTNSAWNVFHNDAGPYTIDVNFSAGFEDGNFNCTMIRESMSAPYGADGSQVFTVTLALDGDPVAWS